MSGAGGGEFPRTQAPPAPKPSSRSHRDPRNADRGLSRCPQAPPEGGPGGGLPHLLGLSLPPHAGPGWGKLDLRPVSLCKFPLAVVTNVCKRSSLRQDLFSVLRPRAGLRLESWVGRSLLGWGGTPWLPAAVRDHPPRNRGSRPPHPRALSHPSTSLLPPSPTSEPCPSATAADQRPQLHLQPPLPSGGA